jgi:uncharacterized OB-fold protein
MGGRFRVRRILDAVAAVQTACERCGTELAPDAAYCAKCGARTRRARRLVRLAVRVEVLFFLLVVGVIVAFIWIYAAQR